MNVLHKRLQQVFFSTCVFILGLSVLVTPAQAVVSGGAASLSFSPTTVNGSSGQNFTVDIILNTGGVTISGVALRARYQVASPLDLEVVSVETNGSLGWSFPVKQASVGGGSMNIDIMGLSGSPTGFSSDGAVRVATVVLRPTRAISNKQVSFDATQTQVLRKVDAADVLGTTGTLTVNASGSQVTTVTTPPTTPPAPTPAPTPNPPQTVTPNIGGTLIDNTTGDVTQEQSADVVDVSGSNDDLSSLLSANQSTSSNQDRNVRTVPNSGNTVSTSTSPTIDPSTTQGSNDPTDFGDASSTGTRIDREDTTLAQVTGEEGDKPAAVAEEESSDSSLIVMIIGVLVFLAVSAGAGFYFWKRRMAGSTSSPSRKDPPQSPPQAGGSSLGSTSPSSPGAPQTATPSVSPASPSATPLQSAVPMSASSLSSVPPVTGGLQPVLPPKPVASVDVVSSPNSPVNQ